jgi:hypothetical protein
VFYFLNNFIDIRQMAKFPGNLDLIPFSNSLKRSSGLQDGRGMME